MAEGRVAEVVGERQGLGEILVQPERPRQCARDLGNLDRVGQPGPVVVALIHKENLCFLLEPTKCCGMDNAVAVALEFGAGRARRLRKCAASAVPGIRGKDRRFSAAKPDPFGEHCQSALSPRLTSSPPVHNYRQS